METWIMQLQSLGIVLLMTIGIAFKRKKSVHVKIMSSAMIWDVLLILQIELSRSAILKASKALTNPMALNIHVSIAVATVILYGFMVYTGKNLLNGKNEYRNRHKNLGFLTFSLRILTFITSFWAVTPKV